MVLIMIVLGSNLVAKALAISSSEIVPLWEPMTETQLQTIYFDYEICILKLRSEQYYYNYTIFNQPACNHLLQLKSSTSSSSSSATLSGSKLDKVNNIQSIHKRCWLGAKQQRQDDGLCIGKPVHLLTEHEKRRYSSTTKERKYCIPLNQRLSFWNLWSHIPSYINPLNSFLQSILKFKFELINFHGDSMSLQLAQHLLCQLMRRNVSSVQLFGDFFSVKSDGGVSAKLTNIVTNTPTTNSVSFTSSSSSSSSSLMIMFKRNMNRMGCTDLREHQSGAITGAIQLCGPRNPLNITNIQCIRDFQSDYIYTHTLQHFNSGAKWGNTSHIFMLPIRIKHAWEYIPYAKALLLLAKLNHKYRTRILILSPFAQHFLSHPIGLYHNFTKPVHMMTSVCGPHKVQNVTEHPEMTLFKKAITSIDLNWSKYIGTFDLLTYSKMMYDLHPETHSTGWSVDCTHFVYQPVMMDAVWLALSEYLESRPLFVADL